MICRASLTLMLVVLCVLLIPPANAHAIIMPNESNAGEEQEYTVTVVGEREKHTVKVEILIPDGFELIEAAYVKGWEARQEVDGELTSVAWVGELGVDESVKLKLKLRNPDREGVYRFTVIQTYSDGEEVRWDFPGTWVRIKTPSIQELIMKNLIYIVAAVVAAAVSSAVLLRRR
ncbi:MAG TPA: DUF1775 domain-containing protein [Candidatus Caldiarchaeum subterraneum]|uniref:DUF1775 domain-containing protein n=1 Tax=Caldiarchaeum subterraneum TaxID=311458 RepID=A0A833EAB6_CALS0|nr:DUF1775 domain-containing protein [Candidatus Caldarchaeum subterraneum]